MSGHLCPFLDILLRGTDRVVRGSKVALVESANLVLLECTYDGVQNTAVVEENHILLVPRHSLV